MTLTNKIRKWTREVSVSGPPQSTRSEVITELHDPGAFAMLVHHLQGIRVGGKPISALGKKNFRIESAKEDGVYAEATLTGPDVLAVGLSKA